MYRVISFIMGLILVLLIILAYPTIKVFLEDNNIEVMDLEGPAVTKQWEFTKDVAKLIEYADELGYELTFGEVWRTMYQQRHNVAIGVSWTYNSKHLKRRAVDFNLFINGKLVRSCEPYEPLGDYWESLSEDNRWGGRWRHKDCPHFQRN